jgi:crotonobetainyl-CoA:carnitine CoA-transferase CaiB-like acyl-CoA transferase
VRTDDGQKTASRNPPDDQEAAPTEALAGLNVLDLSQALAGPFCTMILGDLGATVIKVERPGCGDQTRGWGPPFLAGESAYYLSTNRNKRSLTLDFSRPAGQEVLARLLDRSDILVVNIPRWESLRKVGLDYETVHGHWPSVIYAIVSAFGMDGPYAGRNGYDLVAQAMSGTMSLTGEPEGEPMRFPTPISDMTAGLYLVIGILAALQVRAQTGQGQLIDISLVESQRNWLTNLAGNYFATGEEPTRMGNVHPTITPYQPFRTQDGYIILAVGTERLWQDFCQVLGIADTVGRDPRFATNPDRNRHRAELVEVLTHILMEHTTAYWLPRLEQAGIPTGPIYNLGEALADPQVEERGGVVELPHTLAGAVRSLGNPVHLSTTPPTYRQAPPTLGEHSEEILVELGYTPEAVASLRSSGTV